MSKKSVWLFLCLLLPFINSAQAIAVAVDDDDVVVKAMKDEMERSLTRLKLDGHAPPYFLSYDTSESDRVDMIASLGAMVTRNRNHWRSIDPTLRVGSYVFDNSKFIGDASNSWSQSTLPIDNNYEAMRRKLWLSTDTDYKKAVEVLEEKRAHLKRNNIDDKLDDFSKEEPEISLESRRRLKIDEQIWSERIKKLSSIFREYPAIQLSTANLKVNLCNRNFVSSEGTRIGEVTEDWVIVLAASTQSKDGERIKDIEVIAGHKESDLPSMESMEQKARLLADRLTTIQNAPVIEDYDGPVLFEGQAAAQFMEQVLCENLASQPESITAGYSQARTTSLAEKIGRKILPRALTVVDDPFARELDGQALFGCYTFDSQGVRSRRVILIAKGVLKSLCTDRTPTKYSQHSNGHSNGFSGSSSIVFIQSDSKKTDADLLERGKELALEAELPYFLIVKRMLDPNAKTMLVLPDATVSDLLSISESSINLAKPVCLVKHWVDTGKEEIVRSARFEPVNIRILKDIEMVGGDSKPSLMGRGADSYTHLICPSFLVKSMEVDKDNGQRDKVPILESPAISSTESKQ
ncbi:MAG: hypothetical protein IAF58_00150 [Leptolyngbya sp.]|nr:hypothetical protein [Candidatus Melainabacteria bacterium]